MQFRLLGPLTAEHDSEELPLGANKQQMLLTYLLLRANHHVTVDELVDVLWSDRPPPSAVKNIHLYVHRLRRTFASVEPGCRLETVGRGYSLAVKSDELDLDRVRRLAREGQSALRAAEPHRAAALLWDALTTWKGQPLSTFGDSVAMAGEIRYLEELRLMLYEDYFQAELENGRHRELLPELQRIVLDHPQQERLRFQLMIAFSRAGDRPMALAVYRSGYRQMVDDLGIEPSRELRDLHDQILAESVPSLLKQPGMRAHSPNVGSRRILAT